MIKVYLQISHLGGPVQTQGLYTINQKVVSVQLLEVKCLAQGFLFNNCWGKEEHFLTYSLGAEVGQGPVSRRSPDDMSAGKFSRDVDPR